MTWPLHDGLESLVKKVLVSLQGSKIYLKQIRGSFLRRTVNSDLVETSLAFNWRSSEITSSSNLYDVVRPALIFLFARIEDCKSLFTLPSMKNRGKGFKEGIKGNQGKGFKEKKEAKCMTTTIGHLCIGKGSLESRKSPLY